MAFELSAFGPGEQATYRVSYLGFKAGTAQLTVGAQTHYEGHEVWPIVALAKTESLAALYPIKDKFITYWAHPLQRSIGNELFADENRKRRRQKIQLTGVTATVTKQKHGENEEIETFDIHPASTDMAAVMFALRNVHFKQGETIDVPVFTGARSFTLRAFADGEERIQTQLGEQNALRIRVQAQLTGKLETRRDILIFLSQDEQRIPLKIEAELALGSIVAELVEYKPGRKTQMQASNSSSTPSGGGLSSASR